MSEFLNELRYRINETQSGTIVPHLPMAVGMLLDNNINKCHELINSLGENARRMLEIGILQDELIKLGFEFENISDDRFHIQNMIHDVGIITFWRDFAVLNGRFYYTSPTWQEDLINRVKELIK